MDIYEVKFCKKIVRILLHAVKASEIKIKSVNDVPAYPQKKHVGMKQGAAFRQRQGMMACNNNKSTKVHTLSTTTEIMRMCMTFTL